MENSKYYTYKDLLEDMLLDDRSKISTLMLRRSCKFSGFKTKDDSNLWFLIKS